MRRCSLVSLLVLAVACTGPAVSRAGAETETGLEETPEETDWRVMPEVEAFMERAAEESEAAAASAARTRRWPCRAE